MFVLDDLLAIGATASAVTVWLKRNDWVMPILSRAQRKVSRLMPGARRDQILAEILYELKPNGGYSLKDTVNRIEQNQKELRLKAQIVAVAQSLQQNMLNIAVARFDDDGLLVEANQPCLHLLGLTHREALGSGWKNAIAEDARGSIATEWCCSIDDRRDVRMDACIFNRTTREKSLVSIEANRLEVDDRVFGWLAWMRPVPMSRSEAAEAEAA